MHALLDRGLELAELRRRLDDARAGSGRVIVIEGPAGIGKSSLLDVAVRGAEPVVLRARAHPLERDAAWAVARQLVEPLRNRGDWAALTTGAAGLAGRVLAPEDAEPAGGDAVHAAVRGLVWLLVNLCERGPVVLAVDDVHWADAASLRWLAVLAGSLHELPAAVVCAVRSGEPAGAPELLAEVLAAAPEPPVRPRPLGAEATAALVRARLPGADDAFVRACHDVTAGNPFLLVTLLAQLAADGVAPTAQAAARLGAFGPEQVARTVERQLARLPSGAADLARAVAVLGPGTPLRRAAALARLELPVASEAADALRAAGLVDAGASLSLVHPLIAAALYEGLAPGRRATWHARAARLLEVEGADAEAVGLHLVHSEPVGDAATVDTLREAAARASTRGSPPAAAVFLRRALAEPPTAVQLAHVRLDLGLALAWGLRPGAYEQLSGAVAAATTPAGRSEAALRGARALGMLGDFESAFTLARLGLEDAHDAPAELRARLEAEFVTDGWLQLATNDVSRALTDHPGTRALGLWRVNAAMRCAVEGGTAARARELLRPVLADGTLDAEPESLLRTTATICLLIVDDVEAARELYEGVIERAAPRGWLVALAHGCMLRSFARTRFGEIAAAAADARLSFESKVGVVTPTAILWTLTFFVDALTELDELGEADAALARLGQLGEPAEGLFVAPLLLQARARLRLAQRRTAEALADALAAGERAQQLRMSNPVLADWRTVAVAAHVALGDPAAARPLALDHLALAEAAGIPSACGAGLRAVAACAGPPERLALLERAVDVLAASPARLEHTRALLDLGAALRRANRRADARVPLRLALDQAERGGMRLLARRARDELVAAGARPRRASLTGPASLTAAEDRVARLAAQGHTNRTIAERLYVSERTVETHLTRAFDKLQVARRTELAEALAGPGGVTSWRS